MRFIGSPILAFPGLATPWFAAAGAALVAIPILIHLLNRRRFKTVSWAAMDFLLRALRKNRKRMKFEQWILLATRCLLFLLLGLALARPTGCQDQALGGQATALRVFVIDNSYSAGYVSARPNHNTHLDQARHLVRDMLNRGEAGPVVLICAGKPARTVFSSARQDPQAALAALDSIEQSYGSTDLQGALQLALQSTQEYQQQPAKNLYLLTDATRSAWLGTGSQGLLKLGPDLSSAFGQIVHFNLSGGLGQWNAAVVDLKPVENLVTADFKGEFAADVKVFGAGKESPLEWSRDQAVQTGTSRSIELGFETAGSHVVSAGLSQGDSLSVDDRRDRVVDVVSRLKVLIVEDRRGADTLEGSGAFLRLALAPLKAPEPGQPTHSDSPFIPEVIADAQLEDKVLGDYAAVIFAGVGGVTPTRAAALRNYVSNGGALMLFMGDAVTKESYNKSGLLPGQLVKVMDVADGKREFNFDFDPGRPLHPFLRVFANQQNTGLDVMRVSKYWKLELDPSARAESVLNFLLPEQDERSKTVSEFQAIAVEQRKIAAEAGAAHGGPAPAGASADGSPIRPPDQLAASESALAKRVEAAAAQLIAVPAGQLDPARQEVLSEAIRTAPDIAAAQRAAAQALASGAPDAPDLAAKAQATFQSLFDKVLNVLHGDPAIVTHAIGDGRVLFFATSADNRWTSIDAKPNYVSLLQELTRHLIRSPDWWKNLSVGDALRIPPTVQLTSSPEFTDPQGAPVLIEPENAGGSYHTQPLSKPGVYHLSFATSAGKQEAPIAVNVPAADEADVTTVTDADITKALGDIRMQMLLAEPPALGHVGENGNEISWWLLAAVLVLIGFECYMAMKFGHHRKVDGPEALEPSRPRRTPAASLMGLP